MKRRIRRTYQRELRRVVTLSILTIGVAVFTLNLLFHLKSEPVSEPQYDTATYIVSEGDCIETIAQKYKGDRKLKNVVTEIQYLNGVNEIIYPGQELLVPIQGDE